jgi:hypothetical protein
MMNIKYVSTYMEDACLVVEWRFNDESGILLTLQPGTNECAYTIRTNAGQWRNSDTVLFDISKEWPEELLSLVDISREED